MNSTNIISHFLIGVPGSGKSTFANELKKQGDYIVVSTDDIRASSKRLLKLSRSSC